MNSHVFEFWVRQLTVFLYTVSHTKFVIRALGRPRNEVFCKYIGVIVLNPKDFIEFLERVCPQLP